MLGVVMPPTLLALADESRRFESETSGFGSWPTCGTAAIMSVVQARPEVVLRRRQGCFDPTETLASEAVVYDSIDAAQP